MTFQTDNKERRQSDKIIQELKTPMHEMTQQMEILQEKINTFTTTCRNFQIQPIFASSRELRVS